MTTQGWEVLGLQENNLKPLLAEPETFYTPNKFRVWQRNRKRCVLLTTESGYQILLTSDQEIKTLNRGKIWTKVRDLNSKSKIVIAAPLEPCFPKTKPDSSVPVWVHTPAFMLDLADVFASLHGQNEEYVRECLRWLFDRYGTVSHENIENRQKRTIRVQLGEGHLIRVQRLLLQFGVMSSRDGDSLSVHEGRNLEQFLDKIGVFDPEKLHHLRRRHSMKLYSEGGTWDLTDRLASVEEGGVQHVCNLIMPHDFGYVVNGFVIRSYQDGRLWRWQKQRERKNST